MAGLIGKKIGMTSLYDEKGNNLACTVIQAGPCVVTQIKNSEKDGYDAVQIGFDDIVCLTLELFYVIMISLLTISMYHRDK